MFTLRSTTFVLAASILILFSLRATVSGLTASRDGAPDQSHVAPPAIHLVIDDALLGQMQNRIPNDFQVTPRSQLDSNALLNELARGDSLLWIGEGNAIPAELWVGTFRPAASPLAVTAAEHSPVAWGSLAFHPAQLSSAFIKPNNEMPYHNVDEEPRADFLPLLEARDRFGEVVGYPAALMHYYAPSSVQHRFAGSECFFFLFDHPAEALDVAGWAQVLDQLSARFRAHLQIHAVTTDYASYQPGERVQIHARLANLRSQAAATEIYFWSQGPGEKQFHKITSTRRCPDARNESEAITDFLPRGKSGLWTLRVEAWQDPDHAEELGIAGKPVLVDRRDIGLMVLDAPLHTPAIISLNGPSIRIDGRDGFWSGTNYYPSSSWWDWLWRTLRPLKVADDFSAMRRSGYRIVRIWVDPFLDEQSLRAMDAAIYLAAQHGIVLDICVFTQWVRTIGFERENGEHVSFDFRGMRDFNVYGISFRNLNLQREYMSVLARRWRGAGNVIYNLSNETYVKDPDPTEMDQEAQAWPGIPKENGIMRDTLLFRHWADTITTSIRAAGGHQLVIPGHVFSTMGGGDNYQANRNGNIESWHNYSTPESTAWSLQYVDPACAHQPVMLEEFGAKGWNSEKQYEGTTQFALASGAAAAMSYEWGVEWLASELDFTAQPLREFLDFPTDPRWFAPVAGLAKVWSPRAVGIHPAPSGFAYGSTYHGTPFPAPAAVALGRLGRMGLGLGRAERPEQVYVVIPTAYAGARTGMDKVTPTLAALWKEKAVFGVIQEDCLGSLPKSARLLICPNGVSDASKGKLDSLRKSGIEILMGRDESWKTSAHLRRLSVTPGDSVSLLVRRTVQGTLYSLMRTGPAQTVTLTTERGRTVSVGLDQYAMAQESAAGINWVQASGDVMINGTPLCTIERGRAIMASADGLDLLHSRHIRVLADEPTTIKFAHGITAADVLDEIRMEPLGSVNPAGTDKSTIDVDSELVRYVFQVNRSVNP